MADTEQPFCAMMAIDIRTVRMDIPMLLFMADRLGWPIVVVLAYDDVLCVANCLR